MSGAHETNICFSFVNIHHGTRIPILQVSHANAIRFQFFYSDCKRTLYFSKDGGKRWAPALHYLVDYDWGSCERCVVVSMHRVQRGHQFRLPHKETLVVYTQDLFQHKRKIIENALGFRHVGDHLFVASQAPDNSDGMRLWYVDDQLKHSAVLACSSLRLHTLSSTTTLTVSHTQTAGSHGHHQNPFRS